MGVLFLNIGIWSLVVYLGRVAVLGNPLHLSVVKASPDTLLRVEQMMREGREPATAVELQFVRRVSQFALLEMSAFGAEVLLLLIWLTKGQMAGWCLGLLLKNLGLVILSFGFARRHAEHGVFESLAALPPWFLWTDRLSALVSAIGLFLLLLWANGVRVF